MDKIFEQFDKKYKCDCILCQEEGHKFTTTTDDMKEFIKSAFDSLLAEKAERVEKLDSVVAPLGDNELILKVDALAIIRGVEN